MSNALKTLHLLCRVLSTCHSSSTKLYLYVSLVRSKLSYCSQVWRPHLIKDITNLEKVQRRSTKFILNDFSSSYKDRLIKLKLFPLSLWFEYLDIMFLIKCVKNPQSHFDIFKFIQFVSSSTRSSTHIKLKSLIPISSNTHLNFLYFNRVVKLWNALPVIDITLSISAIKHKIKALLWLHFLEHFDSDIVCTWHYLCPCSHCFSSPSQCNYTLI